MKEILEATYFGIFGRRMSKNASKYNILHQIIDDNQHVYVFEWKGILDHHENNKVDFQRKVIDFFLKNELKIEEKLHRSSVGAPYFKRQEKYISISHSEHLFAIQLSESDSVGVDIQVVKSNIHRGRAYFINDFEENTYEMTDRELHLIWAAKECVYKLKKGIIEHYREDITVVQIKDAILTVELNQKNRILCSFLCEEKYALVFCVKELCD